VACGRLLTKGAALRMVAPGPEGFIDRLPEPDGLPDWISKDELDHYISEFFPDRVHRGPELVSHLDRNWETPPN